MNPNKCKAKVSSGDWGRTHQCTRNIWKDQHCKTHHPESVEKRRKESDARDEEKKKTNPYFIARELKKENERLTKENEKLKLINTRLNGLLNRGYH